MIFQGKSLLNFFSQHQTSLAERQSETTLLKLAYNSVLSVHYDLTFNIERCDQNQIDREVTLGSAPQYLDHIDWLSSGRLLVGIVYFCFKIPLKTYNR